MKRNELVDNLISGDLFELNEEEMAVVAGGQCKVNCHTHCDVNGDSNGITVTCHTVCDGDTSSCRTN